MRFGALGDIHGDFDSVRRILRRHPEVPFWLCVGDVADAGGGYEPVERPLHWIKGNNENFDAIAAGGLPAGHHVIPNGTAVEVGGLRVAGLGGTFAPTWFDTPAEALPHPKKGTAKATQSADKRRHFVREEADACARLAGVDILLTHEAPTPFRPFPGGRGPDAGKAVVNGLLASIRPRLHLFGHHHCFSEQEVAGVRSVGLDLVSRSYLLLDPGTLEYHVMFTVPS
jgi:uncharacterized protein